MSTALAGAAFIGWKIYDNYMQKQVQAAQEAGNAWKESNSSIEDYKNRVVELRNQLASGTLTESEAYQAKSELLSIQESLTDSYGSQADGIDIVNGSLREQIGLMDQLSQSDANKYLNENQKGINKATKEMEKNRTYYLGQFYDAEGDEASEALKKAIKNSQEKYGDLITTQQGLDGTLQLYFKGDATQAEAALNDFMTDVRNASDELGGNWMLDNIFSYAESGLKSANKVLDKYQEVYEQAKAAEIAGDKTEYKDKSGDSKTAAEWMRDYSQAVKEYNDALASGDSSKIAEAKTNFDAVDKSVQSLLESDMSGYADSFTEISDQLNTAAISANDFKDAVNGIDTSDGAKEIADAAKELKDLKLDDKDFIYAFETDGVQEGEEQINALVQAALDAGVISDTSSESLQSLANMLIELGVVSGEPVEGMEETTVSMSDMRTAAENLVNGLTTVQSVLSSQQNGKSVSLADFNSDELADYRGALEYVNGTMQLNAEKVREIAKAKAEEQVATNNTNKALEQAQYLENARQIEQYRQQLQDASFAEGETAESIQASIDALLSENSAIADNCAQYDLLSASIQEAVGAYQNWLNAQGASDYGDMANDTVSAMDNLEETQYEHYISEQKKLLDNLYDEYEAILNERLDNIDALMADMINTINQNSANISTTLQTQSDKVGYDLTAAMKSIWTNEGGAGSIITKYGESFLTQMTSVNDVITKIAYKIGAMVKESDKKADSTISSATPSTKTDTSAKPPTQANTPAKQPTNNTPKFNEDVKRGVAAAIWIYGSKSGWGNDPNRKKRLTAKFGASNAAAVQSYINAHANNGDLYRYWVSTGKSNLSKYYYSAFKKGGLADYTGMAWLDGTPTEPEMVLNPKDTQNFIAWRGYSHVSMFILAGVCGICIGLINEILSMDTPIWLQAIIGSCIVTTGEFISGCILNLWLGLGIWDYSNMPFNLLGQICLPFSLLWIILSACAIVIDDYERYWFFGEEKPYYRWKFKEKK